MNPLRVPFWWFFYTAGSSVSWPNVAALISPLYSSPAHSSLNSVHSVHYSPYQLPLSHRLQETPAPRDRESCHSLPDRKPMSPTNHESPAVESRDSPDPKRLPVSWHPSAPVEPPLEPTQMRSIGVHSILNPPKPASPPARLAHPLSASHSRRLSMSPGMGQRPTLTPVSPSARFVGANGYPPKPSASQSPLAQESRPGVYSSTPGSPLPVDHAVGSAPGSVSLHSTPTFHSRRTSAGPTATSSQETSPSTPHSVYSQLGRSSPAIASISAPQPTPPFLQTSPYGLPSVAAARQPSGEDSMAVAGSQPETAPGMIPCVLDLKSGSSSQAEKRKANSDASRRFRNRKRNEVQMEQKITAQQDEIRKQADTIHRQAQEIHALRQERDYYRSERDFYREHCSRVLPPSQLPARPSSPRALRSFEASTLERGAGQLASTLPPTSVTPMASPRQQATWPGSATAYPAVTASEYWTR